MKRHCAGTLRPPKVAIHTLGCAKNVVDSDTFAGVLQSSGFEYVTQPSNADVLVVNTCGFIDDAKIESVQVLLEAARWKQKKRGRRVLAMGCLTQRDGDEIRDEIPELDGVFGIGEWSRMIEALGANPLSISDDLPVPSMSTGRANPGSAYLRVSDGCSHACAFCAIPQMRGLYRSEPMEILLRDAEKLAQDGVKELLLIGQETTSYGVDIYRKRMLVELCQRLSDIVGIEWIRILYAHPPSTPPHLLQELATVPKLVPYIDYPIEHASDRMLKLMNRKTTGDKMKTAIAAFRDAIPRACVRTTVLVGFPGETDDDFEQLYHYMSDVKFERAGVFTYSPQAGTAGAERGDLVEEGIALDRLDRLMKLQRQICLERNRTWIGHDMQVIIERNARGSSWGRGPWDAPDIDARVKVNEVVSPGQMINIQVDNVSAYQLSGNVVRTGSAKLEQENVCGSRALPVLSPY